MDSFKIFLAVILIIVFIVIEISKHSRINDGQIKKKRTEELHRTKEIKSGHKRLTEPQNDSERRKQYGRIIASRNHSAYNFSYTSELKGKIAEQYVADMIEVMSRNDNIKIINNAYLPLYDSITEIDHLVFGRFGVLVVETKGVSGVISGSGKILTQQIGSQVHDFYNPQYQNKTHVDNVSYHLRKNGFRNTPVYGAVVFSNSYTVYPPEIGMDIMQLEKYYHSLPDAGCNPNVLYNFFLSLQAQLSRRTFKS